MSKDYSVLNRMIRDSNDKLVVAYDKGYKQGTKDGYEKGYEEGRKECYPEEKAYEDGLNDAWECARKIVDMDCETVSKIFEGSHYDNVFIDCKASDAIERIRKYEKQQTEKSCATCGQPKDYKDFCIPYKEGRCKIPHTAWIPKKENLQTSSVCNEHEENQSYEKDFEGCDRCIFETCDSNVNPCRFCKHNDPSYTESHFIPKPCDHEWVKSNGFVAGVYPIHYCKKCKLLRIEV